MHKLKSKLTVFFAGTALLGTIATVGAAALGSQFTYQGRISDGGSPLNGIYEVSTTLWDAASAGALRGSNAVSVTISNGLLTLPLDFGANVFNGEARWLSFGLRTNGGVSSFTVLNPRQPVQPAPYSLFALGVSSTNITGTLPNAQLPANVARVDQSNSFTANQNIVGNLRVNDKDILLSTGNDNAFGLGVYASSHGKTFAGASPDGPVLYGYAGGALGTSNQFTRVQKLALVWQDDNVGIGTATPTAKLDVRGDVKLGPQGQFYAAAGEENTRLLWGAVNANGAVLSGGTGCTVTRTGTGTYRITFAPFPNIPALLINPARLRQQSWASTVNYSDVAIYDANNNLVDEIFFFFVIGSR